MSVEIIRTVRELRARTGEWRRAGETIALIPTMGALHEGHLSLAREGLKQSNHAVLSIFVNPQQFSPNEDFDSYPRTFEDDVAKFESVGGNLIWAPTPDEMYRPGFATHVQPGGAAEGLETDFRPHFFRGVATVCCKLFTQTQPDIALFGEKDYQQLRVVTQMVRDLDLPLKVVGCPTIREADGLAMSSRNAYLSSDERKTATRLYDVISKVAADVGAGRAAHASCREAAEALRSAGFGQIDYVVVRDSETLGDITQPLARPARVLAAAWLGKTRLIDNLACLPR